MTMRTTFLFLFLGAVLSLMAACGGQPTTSPVDDQQTPDNAERIQLLLMQAQDSPSPQRQEMQLEAAALLLHEQQQELAQQLIDRLSPGNLSLEQFGKYAAIAARLYIQQGDFQQALLILETPRLLQDLETLPIEQQLQLNLQRAEVFALLGSHIASARQRIYLSPILEGAQQKNNREALWRSLMYVSTDALTHYLKSTFGGEYQGWLELALIAKDNQGDLDEQIRQLDQWHQRWSSHPANGQLPGGLELIKELATSRPQQLALLLPLTGKLAPFGKAVRDGFIAALYQTRQRGGHVPQLKVYNSEDSGDFITLYHKAVSDGAEMIVGPLEKQRVRLLFDQVELPVPTLALNRIDNYGQAPTNMFQFGLAPQDEAQQIADIAFLENHRKALIIAPEGEWGKKVSQSFIQRWQQLEGEVITESIFSGQRDYSSSMKQALTLHTSENRAKRIEKLAAEHIEFFPRRRQDIDMVFLLARPQQARSIKPLLAYHYASDLPVYGTSRLYSGYDDPIKDRDLNGVRFTDMPWILNPPSELQQQISQHISNSKQYQRMYALGVDSFQLHPRLRLLDEIANSRVYGQTGTLRLNQRKQIERRVLFAQIKNSRAKLIPTVDQSLNITRDGGKDVRTMANEY
jgi:uncharacterized protein